ncbi:alpha/beta fold hydrolase [Streptomyces sp. NBC_00249]|uniref:alpha/beta fold hydrolase n=1 Tax=Streptomyces sp. NBC_00249 TaxID=2975690 RepID=UPI002253D050|nr:alpha/beta fold hydrolase [Streptomyces sp. NBC_00249]MCX5193401.1 alpha/beta fold hydrolase [Streptomyces sp. NBC_00249]
MASLLSTTLDIAARVAPGPAGRIAFGLFIRPLGRPRLRPEEAGVMGRAETGRLDVGGVRVATYRWGDGAHPVLLVHGWSSRASRFAGFVEVLLAQGHSVVAFDAPGHGESGGRAASIRDFRDIIRRLDAEYGPFPAVVAHSIGVLSTLFTLREGVRVERVVALAGIAHFDYLVDGFRRFLDVGPAAERALRRHVEHRVFADTPDIWRRLDARRDPGESPARILLVHDTEDDMSVPGQSRAIAAAFGERARLIETQGLGHRRILGDPDVIAAAAAFLAEPGAGAGGARAGGVPRSVRADADTGQTV